jgi:hypothetical protein
MNGKGSTPRPLSVSLGEFAKRWHNTFNSSPAAREMGAHMRTVRLVTPEEVRCSEDGAFIHANPR